MVGCIKGWNKLNRMTQQMLRHSGVAQQGALSLRLHPIGFPSKDVQEPSLLVLQTHSAFELVGCFSVFRRCPHSSSSRSVGSPRPSCLLSEDGARGLAQSLPPTLAPQGWTLPRLVGRGQQNLAGHSGEHSQPSQSPKALPENKGELETTRAKPRDNYGSWILLCIWDIIRLF